MLRKSLLLVVALVIAILGFAATRPSTFTISRSTTIKASAEKLFPRINELRAMNFWSPYVKRDPNLKQTYTGPAAGPGAGFAWEGNSEVGKGEMKITESVAPTKVQMDLHMMAPIEANNMVTFTLAPGAQLGETRVTWAMTGASPLVSRVIGLFVNIDAMVGRDFEAGLAMLKAQTEAAPN